MVWPILLVWGTFGLSPPLRPLVMASSCKVHTLGLPHFNPQFLLAHCVPQLLYPFTLTCGNLGPPVLATDKQGLCSCLFTLTISLDCIVPGWVWPGWVKPKELRECTCFLSCGKVCDTINPFPSRLCMSQTLCSYLQASSWYLEGSLKCLFPLPATMIIVSVSTQRV